MLTGENGSYRGVAPTHPFDTKSGALGAFELTARYHVLQSTITRSLCSRIPTAAGDRRKRGPQA